MDTTAIDKTKAPTAEKAKAEKAPKAAPKAEKAPKAEPKAKTRQVDDDPPPKAQVPLGQVPIEQIVVDDAWNTRLGTIGLEVASPDGPGALEALADSIRQVGVIEPLGLVPNEGADKAEKPYLLRFGFRRMKAAIAAGLASVPAVLIDSDPATVRLAHLAENVLRVNLTPYELMEALARIQAENPSLSAKRLGRAVGKDHGYVSNLLRVRRKVAKELLDDFAAKGASMSINHLVKVAALPTDEQVEAYNDLVRGAKGGRPKGASSGEAHRSGEPVETKHLKRWKKMLEAAQASGEAEVSDEWYTGAMYVIDCALGRQTFSLEELGEESEED